jgi:predicted chitinase
MYRGRGPFQVTGRAAYTQAGKALDIDLENHPELASDDPKIGAHLAAWYWKNKQTNLFDTSRKKLLVDPITKKSLIAGYTNKKKKTGIIFKKFSLSDLADRGDFFNVSHAVNPGLLNLKDRLSDSKKATKLLSPTLPPK